MAVSQQIKSETLETDVLVLGGGIAGCFAAIRARELGADVVMVDKGNLGRSGLSHQMSGVLTCFDPDTDDREQWYRECVEAGEWLCDQHRLEGMVTETAERINDLERWGVTFQRDNGKRLRKACVGQRHIRNVVLTNGGLQMMSVLRGEVLRLGSRVLERVMATDLLTSDGDFPTTGQVIGAAGFNIRNGTFYVFRAKAVVIATGPTLAILSRMPVYNLSGDGKAMAFRAGCEMRNIELAHYGYRPKDFNTAPGANILFGEGAVMVNAQGERFMKKWDQELVERSTRSLVGRAIVVEMLENRGPVYLDATHLDDAAYRRIDMAIPIVMRSFAAGGLDIRKDLVPYVVTLTDICPGGIRVNRSGATTLTGLFAAGAATDHAEVGVTDVISIGMASAIGGHRAGEAAARSLAALDLQAVDTHQVESLQNKIFAPLWRQIGLTREEVREHCVSVQEQGMFGPIRSDGKLKAAMKIVQGIKHEEIPRMVARDYHDLVGVIGVENGLLFLELLAHTALLRTESRGSHYREDYPARDDKNWLKWVIAKREGRQIKTWVEPLPMSEYPVRPNGGQGR
ncbi:MAG: FAD-binding protein [Chloroflexi bacterium]|nr:FAD-binding protein [Chloroflexota bacterium]